MLDAAILCGTFEFVRRVVSGVPGTPCGRILVRYERIFLVAGLSVIGTLLGACSSHGGSGTSSEVIASRHALVVPSLQMRATMLLSGLPEPGSDVGPFSGRRDVRLGALMAGPERVAFGYERQILDRQYSNLGRPYNTYMDTTRSTTRVDR